MMIICYVLEAVNKHDKMTQFITIDAGYLCDKAYLPDNMHQ